MLADNEKHNQKPEEPKRLVVRRKDGSLLVATLSRLDDKKTPTQQEYGGLKPFSQ